MKLCDVGLPNDNKVADNMISAFLQPFLLMLI